jgi:hypothetical protein
MDLIRVFAEVQARGEVQVDGSAMRCQKERLQHLDMADSWTWTLFGFRFSGFPILKIITLDIT